MCTRGILELTMTPRKRYVQCIVPGCRTSLTSSKHKIPKPQWIMKKWVEAIGSPLTTLKQIDLMKCFVCEEHFVESDFSKSSKRRTLNTNSVPSVNINPVTVRRNPQHVEGVGTEVYESIQQVDILGEAMSAWEINTNDSRSAVDPCARSCSFDMTFWSANAEEPCVPDGGFEFAQGRDSIEDPCAPRSIGRSTAFTPPESQIAAQELVASRRDLTEAKKTIVKLTALNAKLMFRIVSSRKRHKQTQQNYTRTLKKGAVMHKLLKTNRFTKWDGLNRSQHTWMNMQLNNVGVKPQVI